MRKLWKLMGESLGAAWVNQFGTVDDDGFVTWCNALKDFTPRQIQEGFHRYLKSGDSFLDLVKFRGYCQDSANKPPEQNAAAYLPYRQNISPQKLDEAEERFLRLTGQSRDIPRIKDSRDDRAKNAAWQQRLADANGDPVLVGAVYREMNLEAVDKHECSTRHGLEKHLRRLGRFCLMPDLRVMPA